MITRSFLKVKSGLPGRSKCRRHPLIPNRRNSDAIRSSVVLLPVDRIARMMRVRD